MQVRESRRCRPTFAHMVYAAFVRTRLGNTRGHSRSVRDVVERIGIPHWSLRSISLLPMPQSFQRGRTRYVQVQSSRRAEPIFWALMDYCFDCANNLTSHRICWPRFSLWTVLQIRRPWSRSSQRLHRVSAHRRCQDPNQFHWSSDGHVRSLFLLRILTIS